jgi:redox-sensing transcriptional repressor
MGGGHSPGIGACIGTGRRGNLTSTNVSGPLSPASVSRLPRYLRYLESLGRGVTVVSSDEIAEGSGVSAVQVRKDLSYLGAVGTRGVGYDTDTLARTIGKALGLESRLGVAIVGAGNLGTALANYGGFEARGFRMVAVYDVDRNRVDQKAGGLEVRHVDRLPDDAATGEIAIGIIATPAAAAQDVCTLLVEANIRSILNFAPTEVRVPEGVTVRRVDLATELQILSYHLASG